MRRGVDRVDFAEVPQVLPGTLQLVRSTMPLAAWAIDRSEPIHDSELHVPDVNQAVATHAYEIAIIPSLPIRFFRLYGWARLFRRSDPFSAMLQGS